MAFVITDECLSCGSCAAQCPAEAIDMGELHYEIDQSKCLECGACQAQCPAEAIESVGDVSMKKRRGENLSVFCNSVEQSSLPGKK